jgi:hypothetical protein
MVSGVRRSPLLNSGCEHTAPSSLRDILRGLAHLITMIVRNGIQVNRSGLSAPPRRLLSNNSMPSNYGISPARCRRPLSATDVDRLVHRTPETHRLATRSRGHSSSSPDHENWPSAGRSFSQADVRARSLLRSISVASPQSRLAEDANIDPSATHCREGTGACSLGQRDIGINEVKHLEGV